MFTQGLLLRRLVLVLRNGWMTRKVLPESPPGRRICLISNELETGEKSPCVVLNRRHLGVPKLSRAEAGERVTPRFRRRERPTYPEGPCTRASCQPELSPSTCTVGKVSLVSSQTNTDTLRIRAFPSSDTPSSCCCTSR